LLSFRFPVRKGTVNGKLFPSPGDSLASKLEPRPMIAFGPDKRDARMLIPPSDCSRLRSEIEKRDLEARRLSATGAADLLKHVAIEWIRDKCPQLGAALAFYTVFSLAPLKGQEPRGTRRVEDLNGKESAVEERQLFEPQTVLLP
jgi:hypothetical protein